MKSIAWKIVGLFLFIPLFLSCPVDSEGSVSVFEVTIYEQSVSMEVGDNYQLDYYVSPRNASSSGLYWNVDNSFIVSVSDSGELSALYPGLTTVYAYSIDDGDIYDRVEVYVSGNDITSLSIISEQNTIVLGDTLQLNTAITPVDATTSLLWSSSDQSVLSVSDNGFITTHSTGVSVVSVSANTPNLYFEDSITILVVDSLNTISSAIVEPPTRDSLVTFSNGGSTFIGYSLGYSLSYNRWTPWYADNEEPWFSFVGEAGKNYEIRWDDSSQGSGNYYSDIQVSLYSYDRMTPLPGWGILDVGYNEPQIFTPGKTAVYYLKVRGSGSDDYPFTGSFALNISEATSYSRDESYRWFLNGTDIGVGDNFYEIVHDEYTPGSYTFTVIGSRDGVTFSNSYEFIK